jgi:transposase
VIRLPATVFVATVPVDLHLSFDRLAGIVRERLGADPRTDTLVVFHNRRRTHLKLLWSDGSGYVLLYKRLDHGTYRIPLAIPPGAARVTVSARELALLLEGLDHAKLRAARRDVRDGRAGPSLARGRATPSSTSARAGARGPVDSNGHA